MNYLKFTFTLLLIISSIPSHSFLEQGTYNGKSNKKDKVSIAFREIPGRTGSFMALLATNDYDRIELFLVDQLDSPQQFVMMPMGITKAGRLGVVDDNPRYEIVPTKAKKGKVKKFQIIPANSFSGHNTYSFKKEKDKNVWLEVQQGSYRHGSTEDALQVAVYKPHEHKGTLIISKTRFAGSYTMFEERDRVFVIKRNEITNKGLNVSNLPTGIGVFFKRCKRRCKKQLVLLSPKNGQVLASFTRGKKFFSGVGNALFGSDEKED